MIDSNFDPYEALVQACNAVEAMEQVIQDLVTANNNQAELLENTHDAYNKMRLTVQSNTREIRTLSLELALARKRISELEKD